MRALVWKLSVTMPIWAPVKLIAGTPRSWIAIAIRAHADLLAGREQHVHLARVRALGDLVGQRDQLVGGLPARRDHHDHAVPLLPRCDDPPRGALDRSASATDVPPNFMTTVWRVPRASGGCGHPGPAWAAKDSFRLDARPGSQAHDAAIAAAVAATRGAPRARGRRAAARMCSYWRRADTGRRPASLRPRAVPRRRPAPPRAPGAGVPARSDLAQRLPLERKVAQLFLLGFEGQDPDGADVLRQLRRTTSAGW